VPLPDRESSFGSEDDVDDRPAAHSKGTGDKLVARIRRELPHLHGADQTEIARSVARLVEAFDPELIYVFGSHARDEAGPESDVDVFVDPASDDDFGFLPFMEAYEALRNAFRHQIEIGYSTRTGLSPHIIKDVEHEALRIF